MARAFADAKSHLTGGVQLQGFRPGVLSFVYLLRLLCVYSRKATPLAVDVTAHRELQLDEEAVVRLAQGIGKPRLFEFHCI